MAPMDILFRYPLRVPLESPFEQAGRHARSARSLGLHQVEGVEALGDAVLAEPALEFLDLALRRLLAAPPDSRGNRSMRG